MAHLRFAVALVAALAASPSLAGGAAAEEKPSPEFDRLKALAGEWQGRAKPHAGSDGTIPVAASIRVVSAGSAVMMVTDPGGSHEMVTMFHRDDGALLATHYCAAMNQPRMKAKPAADAKKLAFEFVDGTNLGAHPAHMQRLVLTVPDADHHVEEWTFLDGGKTHTLSMELERKR